MCDMCDRGLSAKSSARSQSLDFRLGPSLKISQLFLFFLESMKGNDTSLGKSQVAPVYCICVLHCNETGYSK